MLRTSRTRAVATVAGLLIATLFTVPAVADRLDRTVAPGAKVDAEVADGRVSTVGFLVTEGEKRKLLIQVKRGKKSPLSPAVRLLRPDGTELDVEGGGGSVKANSKSTKIKLNDLPESGLWRLEVAASDGEPGAYQLKLKTKEGVKDKGSVVVPAGRSADLDFVAGPDSELTLTVKKGKGSALTPNARVFGPSGDLVADAEQLGAVNERKGLVKLKKLRLPHFGAYRIELSGTSGGGGTVKYSLKTKTAKVKGAVPVADAGETVEAEPGTEVQLDGSGSTGAGAGPLSFSWVQVAGEPVELDDPSSATPRFTAPDTPGPLGFELSVAQGGLRSAAVGVGVEVDTRPVSDAGPALRADASAQVTLDGSGSSVADGRTPLAAWTQVSGPAVTLDDPRSATPTFTAPATAATLVFELVVDDGTLHGLADRTTVLVADPATPLADAGRPQRVGPMSTVHLSGLRSRPANDTGTTTWSWTRLAGPEVELVGADTPTPSFMAPRTDEDLLFRLEVGGESATADTVVVRVRGDQDNQPPVTVGNGPFEAVAGGVTLSAGGSSDPDGDDVTVVFGQLAGAGASLPAQTTDTAAATSLPGGGDLFQFAAQSFDGEQYGAPDLIRVTTPAYQGLPLANAGPDRAARPGSSVLLDGTSSRRTDGELDPITYEWRQVSGAEWYDVVADPESPFDPTVPRPTVTLPTDLSSLSDGRTLSFELVVDDGTQQSLPDLVTVRFTGIPRNGKPVAIAGADTTTPPAGTLVTLLGEGTDRDGDDVTFEWQQVAGPAVDLNPGATAQSPTFLAPDFGELRFQLIVDDGVEPSDPDLIVIDVNERPTAAFSYSPSDAEPGDTVTVDAAASSDPEGADLSFAWTQTAGSAIATPAQESFTFLAPEGGVTLRLVVNDGVQDSQPTTVVFTPQGAVEVAPTASVSDAAYGETVTLRANPTDTDGVTYQWRQINAGTDPVVSLDDANAQNPTFSVPVPSSTAFGANPKATFGVVATRSGQASVERTVQVTFFASFNATSRTNRTVYSIIQSNSCLSCHSGTNNRCPVGSGSNARNYGMGTATAFYNNTVGANSCASSKKRVTVNDTTQSYLLDRLQGIGGLMPTGGPGVGTTNLNIIRDWINQGARNN